MRAESEVVVQALRVLEQQTDNARRDVTRLLSVFGTYRVADAAMAMADLHGALGTIKTALSTLRTHAIACGGDYGTDNVESVGELVLRAEMIVVDAQITVLVDAVQADRTAVWPDDGIGALFVGRFKDIEHVAGFARATLQRIDAWMRNRRAVALRDGRTPAESRALHRAALSDGHAAIAALGQDPDFAHMLRAGAVRSDWPEIRAACELLAAVVGVKFGMPRSANLAASDAAIYAARRP
jgi:hypothetical protein